VIKQGPQGELTVADRGSTNGVVVNGARIEADTAIHNGDKIQVGRFDLTLESEDANLVIQPANIPATVKDVMRGDRSASLSRAGETHSGTMAEVLEHLQHVEEENHLLRVLYDAGKALQAKLSIDDIAEQVMSLAF